jgi:hypothetical protein
MRHSHSPKKKLHLIGFTLPCFFIIHTETWFAVERQGPSPGEHPVAEHLGNQAHQEHAQHDVPSDVDGFGESRQ